VRRRIDGLREAAHSGENELTDGVFLVRVEHVQYRWHAQKPFCILRLSVREPYEFGGQKISGRLYCSAKALWKLSWFLRDFGYDTELLGRDELDEKALLGAARRRQDQPHNDSRHPADQPGWICSDRPVGRTDHSFGRKEE